jgi:hypothetical protein
VVGVLGTGGSAAQHSLDLDELPVRREHGRVDLLGCGAGSATHCRQLSSQLGGDGRMDTQPIGSQVHALIVHDPAATRGRLTKLG